MQVNFLKFAGELFFNATYLETTCKQSKLPAILGKFACNVRRNCSVTLLECDVPESYVILFNAVILLFNSCYP